MKEIKKWQSGAESQLRQSACSYAQSGAEIQLRQSACSYAKGEHMLLLALTVGMSQSKCPLLRPWE